MIQEKTETDEVDQLIEKADNLAEKVNRHVEQRKFDTNLKIHMEKRKEDEKKKKREA